MLRSFRDFNLRGNVMHVAVGVLVGLTLYNLVKNLVHSVVNDLLVPLFVAVVGKPDFSSVVLTLNGTHVYIGNFLNAVVSTCFIAFLLCFLVVLPLNSLMARFSKPVPDAPADTRPA